MGFLSGLWNTAKRAITPWWIKDKQKLDNQKYAYDKYKKQGGTLNFNDWAKQRRDNSVKYQNEVKNALYKGGLNTINWGNEKRRDFLTMDINSFNRKYNTTQYKNNYNKNNYNYDYDPIYSQQIAQAQSNQNYSKNALQNIINNFQNINADAYQGQMNDLVNQLAQQGQYGGEAEKNALQNIINQMQGINPNYNYQDVQQSLINKLVNRVNQGLTNEEYQNMLNARMTAIQQQQQQAEEQLQNALYSRGLGQSGAYARGLSDILNQSQFAQQQAISDVQEKALQQENFATQMAQNIAQQQQGLQLQTGVANAQIQQMQGELQKAMYMTETQKQQYAQQLQLEAMQGERQLQEQLGMDNAKINALRADYQKALYMSDVQREEFFKQLEQQYNLSKEQLQMAMTQFNKESNASFWSNIIGSGASILGTILGGSTGGAIGSWLSQLLLNSK